MQSATEWLFKQLWDEPKDKMVWYAKLKQAEDMFQQQIIDAYTDGESQQGYEDEAIQYYNETFKK